MIVKENNIQVDGQTIKGKLFSAEKLHDKNPAVLLIHGWNTTQERMHFAAEALVKKGYICLTFDLRGHGKSDGSLEKVTRKDHIQDVIAAYDFLCQQQNVDITKIITVGSSYGSYLTAALTGVRSLIGIAMRVPVLIPDEGFDKSTLSIFADPMMTIYKESLHTVKENNILRDLSNFSGKVCIVESGKDETIPHRTIENYLSAVSKDNLTYAVMTEATHSLGIDEKRQEFAKILCEWVDENFKL